MFGIIYNVVCTFPELSLQSSEYNPLHSLNIIKRLTINVIKNLK